MNKAIKLLILTLVLSICFSMNANANENIDQIETLPYELNGPKDSEVMLVFLHGYPNTFRMWDEMIGNLKSDYYCLNISYPNYAKSLQLKWGIDLIDLVRLIKSTIEHVEKESDKKYKKIIVAHDWGAFKTYILDKTFPKFVDDIVALDVGPGIEKSVSAELYGMTYQLYLANSFLIGGPVGNTMTNYFIKLVDPYGLSEEDRARLDSSWNYTYFYYWRNIIYYRNLMNEYEPSVPVAYVYGTKKPFMLHNDKWIDYLKNTKGCELHSVEEGHWVMKGKENNDKIVGIVRNRAEKLNKH